MSAQAAALQKPLQQSAFDAHPAPPSSQGSEHVPAKHSPLQQSALVVQAPEVGVHPAGG